MDLMLTDRVYVITGGSKGLGLATARALVADGAKVVISSRDQASVDAAVQELGTSAVGVAVDNSDVEAPRLLIEQAQRSFGRLDGALLSVGGPAAGGALNATDADWRAAFENVFLGTVRLARELAAAMTQEGSLAFVLSTSVKAPVAGLGISNGLRPGLAMVAKEMANDLGPRGIRVNTLLPGRLDTDRVQFLDAASGDAVGARETWSQRIPLGRYGRPEEFGAVAAFVLSPRASFLTGAAIPVDGGLLPV